MSVNTTKNKTLVCLQKAHVLTPAQIRDLGKAGENLVYLHEVDPNLYNQLANMSATIEADEVRAIALGLYCRAMDYGMAIVPIGHPSILIEIGRLDERHGGRNWTFAMSGRKSVEKTLPDGTVTKTAVFDHVKFLDI